MPRFPRDEPGEYKGDGFPRRAHRDPVQTSHHPPGVALSLGGLCHHAPALSECFPLIWTTSPSSVGKPEQATKGFGQALPSSRPGWVTATHTSGCGHPSPFMLCRASDSPRTPSEGGSGLTTAGMPVFEWSSSASFMLLTDGTLESPLSNHTPILLTPCPVSSVFSR